MKLTDAADAILRLERMVTAAKGRASLELKFSRALSVLQILAPKEDIPLAIVGGTRASPGGSR